MALCCAANVITSFFAWKMSVLSALSRESKDSVIEKALISVVIWDSNQLKLHSVALPPLEAHESQLPANG